MKIMLETTVWDDPKVPNHVYVFDDALQFAIGYVPAGEKKLFKFKTPIAIDRRGRTFESLGDDDADTDETITVAGSKGQRYYLSKPNGVDWCCTCPGFKFHGTCKHITSLTNK